MYVWVGLGSPKQEHWNDGTVDDPVMTGVECGL